MIKYIVTRFLFAVPAIFVVSSGIFVLFSILPGDVAAYIAGSDPGSTVDSRDIERIRKQLGLDRPLYERYFSWLGGVIRLDFGMSYLSGRAVREEIGTRIPYSLPLALLAVGISVVLGVGLGAASALARGSWFDYGARVLAISGIVAPSFVIGILVLFLLQTRFHWFPPLEYSPVYKSPWAGLQQLLLPALITGYRQTGVIARMTRSTLSEVLGQDYIRTARAKGLEERTVVSRHALRNALLPVVSLLGLEMIGVFGSLVIIESLFNIPGMGRLIIDGLNSRDVPLVQGAITVLFLFVVAVGVVTDIVYGWLDPRVKHP